LDKCRLLISQYNILYDEFQRDASLKNVAVFPKIDILNEVEFRENAEQSKFFHSLLCFQLCSLLFVIIV
jgi:hypothetical protein